MLPSQSPIANKLLAALSRADYQRLQPSLETVTVDVGDVLCQAGDPIKHVYFPNDCLVSLLTVVDGSSALAVSLVSREGMAGVALALGVVTSPVRALVQGGGTAIRMKATPFRNELRQNLPFQREVFLYANSVMTQTGQTAVCNRFHVVEARLARWLLLTRDRIRSDHFHMTHEFLATMLGVRRVGVTNAAHALKVRCLIDYSRGNIDIIDGPGLEAAACSCYATGCAHA